MSVAARTPPMTALAVAEPRVLQVNPRQRSTPRRHVSQHAPVGHSDGHCVGYAVAMPARLPSRRRPKVTATLDPDLLASVDAHVAAHPDLDRSAVIDAALRLWHARELELALAAQFAIPDGVDPVERQTWDQLRRAATARQLGTRDPA